jgi:hypothetical protein
VQFKHGADPDLAANPGWRSVIERSRDEARPLSTLPTPLFGTAELGYRIVWPVYEDGIVPEAVADRRARLRGRQLHDRRGVERCTQGHDF